MYPMLLMHKEQYLNELNESLDDRIPYNTHTKTVELKGPPLSAEVEWLIKLTYSKQEEEGGGKKKKKMMNKTLYHSPIHL